MTFGSTTPTAPRRFLRGADCRDVVGDRFPKSRDGRAGADIGCRYDSGGNARCRRGSRSRRRGLVGQAIGIGDIETCGSPSGLFLSSTSTFRCGDIAKAAPRRPMHCRPSAQSSQSYSFGGDRAGRGNERGNRAGSAGLPGASRADGDRAQARRIWFRHQSSAARRLGRGVMAGAGGIVDPADIDLAIRDGLGLRWATSGPFETLHLNGSGSFADYLSKAIPVLWPLMEELRKPFVLEDDTLKCIADFRDSKVSPAEIVEAKARRGRLLQRLQPILNRTGFDYRLLADSDHACEVGGADAAHARRSSTFSSRKGGGRALLATE